MASPGKQRLFSPGDILRLAGPLAEGGLAAVLPHALDPRVVSLFEGVRRRTQSKATQGMAQRIEETLPERFDAAEARGLAEQWLARRAELSWGRMRGLYASDWRIRLEIEGKELLEQAAAEGRGAVVWFASFCDSSLMFRAIAQSGFSIGHLSMASHGTPGGSRFAQATLGRLHRRAEDRYLRERVLIPRRRAPSYLKRLRQLLAEKCVVTIRGDLLPDSQYSAACLGARLRIAGGAPWLAFQANAPLLTAHAERVGPFHYRVLVEEEISRPRIARRDFIEGAVEEFGRRLDRRLRDNSPDWDGWWAIQKLVVKP